MNSDPSKSNSARVVNEPSSKLRLQALEAGSQARRAGIPRHLCPETNQALRRWWFKGWDQPHHPETPAKSYSNPNHIGYRR